MPANYDSKFTSPTVTRKVGRLAIAAGVLGGLWLVASVRANQITPLGDVVPLDQLEIRVDDLVRLTTALADAIREQKTAELSVKTLQSLQPSATITGLEMQIAQINVQAAQQKVTILRTIAETQLATAQARLEFLRRISATQTGDTEVVEAQPNPRVKQAEAIVKILQMILEIK